MIDLMMDARVDDVEYSSNISGYSLQSLKWYSNGTLLQKWQLGNGQKYNYDDAMVKALAQNLS